MRYKSSFKTLNIHDDIEVYIGTGGDRIRTPQDRYGKKFTELTLTGDPVTIELNENGGIFSPLRTLSATIRIETTDFYPDMFQAEIDKNTVLVYNNSTKEELFFGFITPNIYNQEWQWITDIEIECISPIAALEYYKYPENNGIESWYNILKKCLTKTGYYTKLYFANNFQIEEFKWDFLDPTDPEKSGDNFLNFIYQNENNFFDNDEEKTPWTIKKVLEEFCRFLGVSLVEDQGSIYILDYNRLNNSEDRSFVVYDFQNDTWSIEEVSDSLYTIIDKSHRLNDPEISYEETYNKITLKDNFYFIDYLFPNILDDENIECLHPNLKFIKEIYYLNEQDAVISKEEYDRIKNTDPDKVKVLINVYRFYKSTKYKHTFWKRSSETGNFSLTESPDLKIDTDTLDNDVALAFFKNILENYCGALIMKNQSFLEGEEPSSLSFDTYLITNTGAFKDTSYDIYGDASQGTQYALETPILSLQDEYRVNTPTMLGYKNTYFLVNFSSLPNDYIGTGMSYPVSENDKKKPNGKYFGIPKTNKTATLRVQLMVGDYVCTGNKYSNSLTYGWMKYSEKADWAYNILKGNNTPFSEPPLKMKTVSENEAPGANSTGESLKGNEHSVKNISTYEDYIGEDGWLSAGLGRQPSLTGNEYYVGGDCSITILTPRFHSLYLHQSDNDGDITDLMDDTDQYCNYQYVLYKNLKINLFHPKEDIYDDTNRETDVIFTRVIDERFVNEFSDIELLINTQQIDKNFSYSSVIGKVGDLPYYISKIYDKALGMNQQQENNLLEKYYNHYKVPRIVYDGTLENKIRPWTLSRETNLNKIFSLNYYEYNVWNESKNYNLIEF